MKLWTPLGFAFLAIGAVGVILPLLPTTPFVILAAFCFSKSSPRLHAWLLANPVFGPGLKQWDEQRCISRRTRRIAVGMVILVGGSSVWFFIDSPTLKVIGAVLIAIGLVSILRLNVCGDAPGRNA